MRIVLAIVFFLVVFILYKNLIIKDKDKVIQIIPLLLYIAFNISINSLEYRIVGEYLKLYVNVATIIIFSAVLYFLNKKTFRLSWEYLYFITLLINIIYSIFSDNISIDNFPMFLRVILNYVSIYLCFLLCKSIKNFYIESFFRTFNWLAILNGILGILQMLTKKTLLIGSFSESILYTEGIVDSNRAVGIAGSNNSAGNLGALLFIIALFNLYKKKDLLSLSATMLTFLFILLTQTRIALLGIVPSLILIYTFNKSSTRSQFFKKSLLTISFVGISFLALFLLFDKIYQVFFLNRGNTENSRMIQFNNAINLGAKHHLLSGIGSGQWRSYLYNNFGIVDIPIHSQMLNYLVENGLFVFVVAIVFNIGILVTILKNSYLEKNYKLLALSLFFGNLIVSNFNPNQIYTINIIIYYLVMFYLAYYKKIKISKFKE